MIFAPKTTFMLQNADLQRIKHNLKFLCKLLFVKCLQAAKKGLM